MHAKFFAVESFAKKIVVVNYNNHNKLIEVSIVIYEGFINKTEWDRNH